MAELCVHGQEGHNVQRLIAAGYIQVPGATNGICKPGLIDESAAVVPATKLANHGDSLKQMGGGLPASRQTRLG